MNKTRTATVTPAPTVEQLEREYRATLDREIKAVDALTPKSKPAQVDRAWALAAETNAALKRLQAARGDA